VLKQQSRVPDGGPGVKFQDGLVTPIRSDVTQPAQRHFHPSRVPAPAAINNFRGRIHPGQQFIDEHGRAT
jgi:hypothetical protein